MKQKSQTEKFCETARALEADESEAAVNATLGKIMRNNPPPREHMQEIAKGVRQADPNEDFGKRSKVKPQSKKPGL